MASIWPKPLAAWTLGALAIVPFPILALVYRFAHVEAEGAMLHALLTYSAAVLSFLGGSRWGRELTGEAPRWTVLTPAFLTMMLAWALRFGDDYLPLGWQIGAFIIAFLAIWLWDATSPDLPAWYPRLRTALTAAACVSLAFALSKVWRS